MKTAIDFLKTAAVLVTLVVCLESCNGCLEDDYSFDHHNVFGFAFFDSQGNNLLEIGKTKYTYDSVKIYSEDMQTVVYPPVNSEWDANDGNIFLKFIEGKDRGIFNKKLSRSYYVYFDHTDIDTLDIEFEMRQDKCDKQVISYFKVTYSDSTYFDSPTGDVPGIFFLKQE